jgi:hypothetical protein
MLARDSPKEIDCTDGYYYDEDYNCVNNSDTDWSKKLTRGTSQVTETGIHP